MTERSIQGGSQNQSLRHLCRILVEEERCACSFRRCLVVQPDPLDTAVGTNMLNKFHFIRKHRFRGFFSNLRTHMDDEAFVFTRNIFLKFIGNRKGGDDLEHARVCVSAQFEPINQSWIHALNCGCIGSAPHTKTRSQRSSSQPLAKRAASALQPIL